MPRIRVTRLRKFCNLLAGHSLEQAEVIASASTDLVRDLLPEGQEVVDLLQFQLSLGERLENFCDVLSEIDDAHMRELQDDRNLRQERDAAFAELRERSIQLRDSLDGLFGPGGTERIFQERPVIPTDPVAAHQLMGRVRKNLLDQAFPLPRPLQTGFTLDRAAAVADLEAPFQRLGAVLKTLAAAESASKRSQTQKNRELAEVERFSLRVMRYYEALFDLAGYPDLSDRLRRSTHRVANDEPDLGGADDAPPPAAAPPAAAAPAAGAESPPTLPVAA